MKKTIVISGVNLSEGGPLTIIKSALAYLDESVLIDEYKICAIVHSKNLFPEIKNIELLEFPDIKKSWMGRIIFEYHSCKSISKKLNPYLWFSLHDVTPNTTAKKKAVYCHNPSPFYEQKLISLLKSPLRFMYTKFYRKLYQINIKENDYVVVQQKWIKEEFIKMFKLADAQIIVSLPERAEASANGVKHNEKVEKTFKFFYPAFPREFKNFEVICKAANHLSKQSVDFEILLTIDGSENEYSKKIVQEYKSNKHIKFIGLQSRERIEQLYDEVDCLIFPSNLETWGLPITEFKAFNKPMLVADLKYAYETVGDYDKVKYFSPLDSVVLSNDMKALMKGDIKYTNKGAVVYQKPFTRNWDELFKILLE